MKKVFFFIVVIFFLRPIVTFAKDINIAIVDIDEVISNSLVYKDLQITLNNQNLKYQEELKSHETKIVTLDKEVSLNPNNLDNDQIAKLKKELGQYEIEAQKMAQKKRISLDNAFSKAMEYIKTELLNIMSNVAKEKNLQLLLPKSQILYNSDNVEITNVILQLLNKNLYHINVKFE